MEPEWENIKTDIESINWRGQPITVRNVPARRNTKTNKLLVNPKDVVRAEFRNMAKELGIEDRDLLLFMMLYAKPGPFKSGYVCQKYKLNKMLFYQWKELEKIGLGDSIPHDEFIADRRGPVPKNLWEDLERLNSNGLMTVDGGKRERKTVIVELTKDGKAIANKIWGDFADPYLKTTMKVKRSLFPLDPETIRQRVHADYREYRREYIEADTEEWVQFKEQEAMAGN